MTQRELAEKIGVESNTYARWERGVEPAPEIAVRFVKNLADQYGVASPLAGSNLVSKDLHHTVILERLNQHLDPTIFEACAVDLLRLVFAGIAPVSGGSDMGYDGAIPTSSGEPIPLIVTTGKDAKGNLKKNLGQLKKLERPPKAVVFATSRHLRPRTRSELFDLAADLGFCLRQVCDQTWFASALYREAEWTRNLLNISGRPSALCVVPLSSRPVIGDAVIGRDGELERLRKLTGDALVVGAPGSGKTFLLRALVNEGRALFLADDNREAIANAVRAQQPEAVIVDDSHAYLEYLRSLLHVRNQTSADFRVIAVSWPADRDKEEVRSTLSADEESVISLEPLPKDTIVEIIKSTGIAGPNELLRTIQEQSAGQPGLAVTLAHLCWKDNTETLRGVFTGEALLKSLLPQLTRLVGDNTDLILGAFALGGRNGYPQDTVARFLEMSKYELSQRLVGLGAAGIIHQFQNGSVAIRPQSLAPALVQRAFFNDVGSLSSYQELFGQALSKSDALEVLIGVHARGSDIPELERLLEANASTEQLGRYASIGRREAEYVLEKYPGRIVGLAFGVLESLPDRVIPLLLSNALNGARKIGDGLNFSLPFRMFEDNYDLSFREIEGWLDAQGLDGQKFGKRRRIAVRCIKNWSKSVGLQDPYVATVVSRALATAFRSIWCVNELDPGAGRAVFRQDGVVNEDTTKFLFNEWSNIAKLACTAAERSRRWSDLFELQHDWRHPLARVPMPEELWALRHEFADRILQTIATAAQDHPGIQNRVAGVASQECLIIKTRTDPNFDVLYPHEEDHSCDDIKALTKKTVLALTKEYMDAGAKRSAATLKYFDDEAQLANLSWPRLTPDLCRELAKGVDDPLSWTTEFLSAGCPADLVGPFAERIRGRNRERVLHLLRSYASSLEYRHLFVRIVVTTQGPPKDLVDAAISMASEWPQFLQGFAWHEVPQPTLRQLLACKRPNVAFTVAIGVWNSKERDHLISSMGQDWERAIMAGLHREIVDGIVERWFKDIFNIRPELAEKCLLVLLETDDEAVLPNAAIKIARKAAKGLTAQQKRELINRATGKAFNAGDIITALVDDNPDTYAHLLATEHLKEFHLGPLRSLPQMHWAELVALAADAGFTTDDIIQASKPQGWVWKGPVSTMWSSRQEAYEKFVDHADDLVAEVAQHLSDEMRMCAEHEKRREREEKIWGL